MWDFSSWTRRPGTEPVSPVLPGGFLNTGPSGKSQLCSILVNSPHPQKSFSDFYHYRLVLSILRLHQEGIVLYPFVFWSYFKYSFSSVQSLSHVRLFATPWITACQASLSITNSRSLLKLMSIESVIPSSHLILCCPLLLLPPIPPSIRVFSNESALHIRWPMYWNSASASVFPMNIQGWFPLRVTGLYSLISKGLSSNTVQKHHFFSTLPSLLSTILNIQAIFF